MEDAGRVPTVRRSEGPTVTTDHAKTLAKVTPDMHPERTIDTRADTERIIRHPAVTQDVETPSEFHRRMVAIDAAAASFDEAVEEARANSPESQAAQIVALRNEANHVQELLTMTRQLCCQYKDQLKVKDEQIERQAKTIEAQRKTLADITENQEWSRLYAAHVQAEPKPVEPPLVKLGQGREDDAEGPPLVGVMILGMAVLGILAVVLVKLAGWL